MEKDTLKYQKRNWHKIIAKVYSISPLVDGNVELIVFKTKWLLRMECWKDELKPKCLELRPNDTVHAWFSIKSRESQKGYWWHSVSLMHIETPKEKEAERLKKKMEDEDYARRIFNNDNF